MLTPLYVPISTNHGNHYVGNIGEILGSDAIISVIKAWDVFIEKAEIKSGLLSSFAGARRREEK